MTVLSHRLKTAFACLAGIARDRRGATAIEYGLILAVIVIVMLAALMQVASSTTSMWGNVSGKVGNAQ